MKIPLLPFPLFGVLLCCSLGMLSCVAVDPSPFSKVTVSPLDCFSLPSSHHAVAHSLPPMKQVDVSLLAKNLLSSKSIRDKTKRYLVGMGLSALLVLSQLALHDDSRVRIETMKILGDIRPIHEKTLYLLAQGLQDDDTRVPMDLDGSLPCRDRKKGCVYFKIPRFLPTRGLRVRYAVLSALEKIPPPLIISILPHLLEHLPAGGEFPGCVFFNPWGRFRRAVAIFLTQRMDNFRKALRCAASTGTHLPQELRFLSRSLLSSYLLYKKLSKDYR